MKKIMFNDKYGLTEAVLKGRKTMTRRVALKGPVPNMQICWNVHTNQLMICSGYNIVSRSQYSCGEVVAVAQSYWDLYHSETPLFGDSDAGVFNKMFVKAERMPHHIKITDITVERLQDITSGQCMQEGIYFDHVNGRLIGTPFAVPFYNTYKGAIGKNGKQLHWATPQEAFADLIDKTCGKGTWNSNPLVYVYEFELVD